jgi:hypothetical protein
VPSRKWLRTHRVPLAGATLVVLFMMVFIVRSQKGDDVVRVPFSDLLQRADEGRIAGVVVSDHTLEATLTDGRVIMTTVPASHLAGSSSLLTELEKKRVRIEFRAMAEQPAYSCLSGWRSSASSRSRCTVSRRAGFLRSKARRARRIVRRLR